MGSMGGGGLLLMGKSIKADVRGSPLLKHLLLHPTAETSQIGDFRELKEPESSRPAASFLLQISFFK